jgi:hypothetical protein
MTAPPVPYDLTAERAVLERDAILAVRDTLQPVDFYLEKHAWPWLPLNRSCKRYHFLAMV